MSKVAEVRERGPKGLHEYRLIMLSILLSNASSEIYKWKDSKGNVFFSDSPPPGVKAKEVRIRDDQF